MKNKLFLIFLAIVMFFECLNAQNKELEIKELINEKNWFILDEKYCQWRQSIETPELKWFTESLLNIRFNDTKKAISAIDTLLYKYQQDIGFSNSVVLLRYKTFLLADKGEYDLAADELKNFIDQVAQNISQEELKEFVELYNLYHSLRHVAPPTVIKPNKDMNVPYGLMEINFVLQGREKDKVKIKETNAQLGVVKISIQGNDYIFILDTGCEKTCIFDDISTKLNLQYLKDSVSIHGIDFVNGKLAVLDSISIGEATLCNSLIVTSENFLTRYNVPANALGGILGIDIIKRLGEIQLFPNNKTILIPQNETELPFYGRNIYLDDRNNVIIKAFDSTRLIKFNLDTGNANSFMYKHYFSKYKDEIERVSEKQINYSLGIGGNKSNTVYQLPLIEFIIGDASCSLKNSSVYTDNFFIEEPNADGSLGHDFVKNFSKITLNLNKMFIQLEK